MDPSPRRSRPAGLQSGRRPVSTPRSGRSLVAAGLALAFIVPPAAAQDANLDPSFGVLSLTSGFLPDPNWIRLLAGGALFATFTDQSTGAPCPGHFAEPPDLRVHFQPSRQYPLYLYVDADVETVLLIHTPDGDWHCNGARDGVAPSLRFSSPQAGPHDIWIGTAEAPGDDFPEVDLFITEIEPPTGPSDRAFFGQDDRVEVDASRPPWSMIGRLEADDGYCSGVLVGPALVLTAAHCLALGGLVEAPPVSFAAGYDRGRSVATSAITGFYIPADWLMNEADGSDFALVHLADPIGEVTGWMDVGVLGDGEIAAIATGAGPEVLQGGYSFDQDGVLTAHLGCGPVEIADGARLIHQCDTLMGDSGSPIFVEDEGGYRVIGIESYTEPRPREAHDRNVATYAERILVEMRALGHGARVAP